MLTLLPNVIDCQESVIKIGKYFEVLLNIVWRITFVLEWTGGLFTEDERDGPTELAFKYAVYRINKDRTLLPNITLLFDIQYTPRNDSYRAAKRGE